MTQENHIKTNAEYEAEIRQIHAEYVANFDFSKQKAVGSTYLRQSTKKQNSIGDQLWENLRKAAAMGIFIPLENIFFDAGVSGGKAVRPGLEKLKALLEQGQVKIVFFFSSSRLFREARYMHAFTAWCREEKIRLVFRSGLDTAKDKNGLMTNLNSVLDEAGRLANIEAIRAAQLNLHRQGVVTTTLCHGFIGVPIPSGPLTRRSRPRCVRAIVPAQAEEVRKIFCLYEEGLSIAGIVRWLNYDSGYSPPDGSTSGEWTYCTVSLMLSNRCYLGEFENGDEEEVDYGQE